MHNEINKLRSKFRIDLPLLENTKGKKRKIPVTGVMIVVEHCSKKVKVFVSHAQGIPVTVLL